MRNFLRWLQPSGAYTWRWLSGMPPDGVPSQMPDGSPPARRTLPADTAPPPSGSLIAEIRWDARQLCAEWRERRVRRALGREFRGVERQVLAEQDTDES